MAEVVGVKLEVDASGADKPVKSIRAELKEATAALIKMQEQFGDYSAEARAAAKEVAGLRDRIQEANETAQLFDPGKTFQAVVGVGQAIAGGFAAAEGAMQLFGTESEEVEKALLKVNAAMALATGLSSVKDSLKDFQRLGAMLMEIGVVQKLNAAANSLAAGTMRLFGVATVQTGVAFNVLKAAIVATGIGLLIVILGTVVSKLMDFVASTDTAEKAQKRFNDEIERANNILERNKTAIQYATDLAVQRARIAGKSEEELRFIREKGAQDEINALKKNALIKTDIFEQAKKLGKLKAEELQKYEDESIKATDAYWSKVHATDVTQRTAIADEIVKDRKETADKEKAANDKALAEKKQHGEKLKQELAQAAEAAKEAAQQTIDEIFALQHSSEENELYQLAQKMGKRLEIERKVGRGMSDTIDAWELQRRAIEQKYADERAKKQKDELDEKEKKRKEDLAAAIVQQDAQLETEKAYSEARKQVAEKERETKIRAAQAVAGALDSFSQLAGEQTEAGKAFAIASATISAILGAQQAFTSLSAIPIVGPALGALAAAGAIAAGVKNIRQITAVQVPGGKGSTGGGSALSGLSSGAPISPGSANAQPVQLDQQSLNNSGSATGGRVYVLESDMTEKQRRVDNLQRASIFG